MGAASFRCVRHIDAVQSNHNTDEAEMRKISLLEAASSPNNKEDGMRGHEKKRGGVVGEVGHFLF
jgi:hypothetical protein